MAAHAALLALGIACAGSTPARDAPASASRAAGDAPPIELYSHAQGAPAESIDPDEIHFVGMDDGPVPDFSLRSTDGRIFDSDKLVGRRAFAVVFFATWCEACDLKLEALREALEVTADVDVIGISVDGAETWPKTGDFLKKHGLVLPIVRASSHPKFAIEYNPFSTVPLVVIVGRNGGLVDFQLGYTSEDKARLITSLDLAQRIGPLAPARSAPD